MADPRCPCGVPLVYESEFDCGYCYGCQDILIERSQQRAEWGHFHDGEPCPEAELTHLPKRKKPA